MSARTGSLLAGLLLATCASPGARSVGSSVAPAACAGTAPAPGAAVVPGDEGPTPITLEGAMRLAAGRNLDTRIVREAAREAQARVRQADWRFLPTIRPGVRFEQVHGDVQATEGAIVDVDKHNAFAGAGVSLTWNLSEAVYQRLAARQRHRARCADASAEEARAILRAAEGYLDLQRAQAAVGVSRQAVALYEDLVRQREAATQAGGGFRGEVLGAQARRSLAQVRLRRAEQAYDVAAVRLREVLDLPAGVQLVPAEATPATLQLAAADRSEADMLRQAIAQRPEVRAAAHEHAAAVQDLRGVTRGPLLPDVRVGYDAGGFGQDLTDLDDTQRVAVGVEWKIGPGGLGDLPARDAAAARSRSATLQAERARQRVTREVSQARAEVAAGAETVRLSEQGVADAARAQELFRERQVGGVGNALEAVRAEETLTQARLDYVDAVVEHNRAQVRLLYAVGALR